MREAPVAATVISSSTRFMTGFLLLSVVSGLTIGMAKIVTTFYAIKIGAGPRELGIILGMESLGMVLVTVPAGFLIARHGARQIYFLASLGPMLLHLLMPLSSFWALVAAARGAVGLCIPFRIVSMNGAFLDELRTLGPAKAGWYRGSLTFGVALLGPAIGHAFVDHGGFAISFLVIAALFGLMAIYSRSFFPQRPVKITPVSREPFFRQVRALLQQRDLAEVCGVELLASSAVALFSTFIILVARDVPGLSDGDGVTLILMQGGVAVFALLSFGHFSRNLSRPQMYAIALLLAVTGLCSLGLGADFLWLAFGAACLSAAAALTHLVNMRQLSGQTADKAQIVGLYNLAQMLGGVTGAFGGAFLSDHVAVQRLFLLWLLPVLGTAIIVMRSGRKASGDGAEYSG